MSQNQYKNYDATLVAAVKNSNISSNAILTTINTNTNTTAVLLADAAVDTATTNSLLTTISGTLDDLWNYNVNTTIIDGTLGSNATTNSVDTRLLKQIDIFGAAGTGYHLDVQFSADDSTWYKSSYDISGGSSGAFHVGFATGAPYIRLKNRISMDISLVAMLCGKH
jgi:hypothetical protein